MFALSSFLLILDLVIGVLLLGSDELNILTLDLTLGLVFFCFSSSIRPRFLSVLIFINNTSLDHPSQFCKPTWTSLIGSPHPVTGNTPLLHAIEANDEETVELLVRNPRVDRDLPNNITGKTAKDLCGMEQENIRKLL